MDIENTQTEGSSYCSDDDKYDDSFIDDVELQVSPSSPVLSSKALDDTVLANNKPKDKKAHGKQRLNKNQVIESDCDATRKSEDGDGYLLSVMKSKRALETTVSDAPEYIPQVTLETSEKAEDDICGSQTKEKVDILDIGGKPEREAKMPWDDKGTQVVNEKNELPKKLDRLEEIVDNDEKPLVDDKVDGNKAGAVIIDQILPMSNEKDCDQSLDIAKPKKKRKNKKPEEKTFETDKDQSILKEDKAQEVEVSMNLDIDANILVPSIEMGSDNYQKSKKRRKLQLTDDKFEQSLTCADSMMMDLLLANGKHQEQSIDNRPANKRIKSKTRKKTQDLNIGMPRVADNLENSDTKCEDQAANGLIIEDVANVPPDGKIAALGKKVKVYYTGMLKESGQVFDSNVGRTAFSFRLGDEEVIDGWNIGIIGMRVGDKRRLIIPPSMGFGNHEVGEKVPPNSWLVYDIELAGIR